MNKLSFVAATARYVHRYTMDHVPRWAREAAPTGKFYAPQFASDRQWYYATLFPGEPGHPFPKSRRGDCYTAGQTWPLGQWLSRPYPGRAAYRSGDDVVLPIAQRQQMEVDRAVDDCA